MPQPRSLGNVARTVLETIASHLAANEDDDIEIVMHMHAGDAPAAVCLFKEYAKRNRLALRAITFLLADKQKAAEEVLITAKTAPEESRITHARSRFIRGRLPNNASRLAQY